MKLQFFTKEECPLCDEGLVPVKILAERYALELEVIDIYEQEIYLEAYQLKIPVVVLDGQELGFGRLSMPELEERMKPML
ncbi:glutaredoxin family protein [Bacillus sp. FSL W7-1360]